MQRRSERLRRCSRAHVVFRRGRYSGGSSSVRRRGGGSQSGLDACLWIHLARRKGAQRRGSDDKEMRGGRAGQKKSETWRVDEVGEDAIATVEMVVVVREGRPPNVTSSCLASHLVPRTSHLAPHALHTSRATERGNALRA
ncbi:hypothetical protein ANO11243_053430 [Dothideomycetidae sp. 11243]|nr:hypothetical protein ANO11243_053430 [fungal sp. No.11243]